MAANSKAKIAQISQLAMKAAVCHAPDVSFSRTRTGTSASVAASTNGSSGACTRPESSWVHTAVEFAPGVAGPFAHRAGQGSLTSEVLSQPDVARLQTFFRRTIPGEYDRGLGESHVRLPVPPTAQHVPAAVEQVLLSSGQPLEPSLRGPMESRFRHDFSRVRMHADSPAHASAAGPQAEAYTVGSHIAFARGAYDPKSQAGTGLIAHELAHVVQQSRGHGWSGEDGTEREAAQIGDAAGAGRPVNPVRATPVRIARQPATATAEQ